MLNLSRTSFARSTRAFKYPSSRSIFGLSNLFKSKPDPRKDQSTTPPPPILGPDDLFHPLSTSPILAMRQKAERIKSSAWCPIRSDLHVSYDCPNSGYPTHSSHEAWESDPEKSKYWPRLRESNEDEHDLRSGRTMNEFDLPGCQPYEESITLSNWDLFLYTRGFRSIDDDRSRRHISKLLTYPITIGSILHEFSPYSTRNQRLTNEGYRTLTALRQTLHPPLGLNTAQALGRTTNPIRIFIVGARAESSLPGTVWSQLAYLFPSPDVSFQVYFIGPEVLLPQEQIQSPNQGNSKDDPNPKIGRGFVQEKFGVPAYSLPISNALTVHTLKSAYREVHHVLGPFDPYNDVFFGFSPGFGFPTVPMKGDEQRSGSVVRTDLVQLETNWNEDMKMILGTKCGFFISGFSPADVERDVEAIEKVEGIRDEFDWLLHPGENVFGSQKWEVAEFDPRVAVKSNYAIWGIRGKRYELDPYHEREELRRLAP